MCAWNQPNSVSSKTNVKSLNIFFVPSQTNLQTRVSISGLYVSAYLVRIAEFKPSDAITKSAPYSAAICWSSLTSVSKTNA
jgi:hypothetical protein